MECGPKCAQGLMFLGFLVTVAIIISILYAGGVFDHFVPQSKLEDDDKDKIL
jgi:hypothetical protein